jgi:hypothetical protein
LFNPSMMGALGHTTCIKWLHHFTMMED